MINANNRSAFNYISRLFMIPLLFLLLFAFGVKARTILSPSAAASYTALDKPVTVVIDAGHGGTDAGVMADGQSEKELTLALAKMVKDLNKNENINIILSRQEDEFINPVQRAEMMRKISPDLMISLHINAAPAAEKTGIEAVIDPVNTPYAEQNKRLATILLSHLSEVYTTDKKIRTREKPVHILKQSLWPAALVECGYLSNGKDKAFITNTDNQEKIAKQVLRSIEDYFNPNVNILTPARSTAKDTLPGKNKKVETVTFIYSDGTKETLTAAEYSKRTGRTDIRFTSDTIIVNGTSLKASKTAVNANYFVDGKVVSVKEAEALQPDQISSMRVTKGKDGQQDEIHITTKAAAGTLNTTTGSGATVNGKVSGTISFSSPNSKDTMKVNLTGTTGENGVITIKGDPLKPKPLYVVNGTEYTEEEMKKLDPNKIESINILKNESAEKIYGEKGRNGVVVITIKK